MMRRAGGVGVLFLLGALVTLPAEGQGVYSIRQGARVRLEVDGKRMIGILNDRGSDSLAVRLDRGDTLWATQLARVQRLEVSRERRSDAGRWALAGLIVGAIPGVVAGVSCDCGRPGAAALSLGAFTGGIGLALGAAIGSGRRHDVWEVIPLVTPAAGGSVTLGGTVTALPRIR